MAADMYTFTVPDAVTVGSAAGSVTGWGYSLHNESSSLWLVTTDLSAGTFQHATPDLIFDFPDLGPGATVTVPYDPLTPAGLYQIVWDANAPPGFVNSGTFSLTAEWWSGDPLAGGSFVSNAPTASQPYTAMVTPEPATIALVALPLLLFGVIGARRRRRQSLASLN
jgi:MYXO-CTERM domain-containing protein